MAKCWARVGGMLCLLVGCSPVGPQDEPADSLEAATQALAFGLQGFGQFSGDGATLSSRTTLATAVDAVRTSTGRYTLTFHSLAAATPSAAGQGGTVQIVAVGADNVRCTLAANWTFTATSDVVAKVACRSPGLGPADSGFFAYFGRGPGSSGKSAYARVAADASVASATKFSSSGAAISASHPATGGYFVFLNAADRQLVQVTAVSTTAHCHASLRELGVTTVRCFDDAGAPVDAAFTVNQAGTDSLSLYGAGAFAQVSSTGSLDRRYDHHSCGLGETKANRVGVGRYEVTHSLVGSSTAAYQLGAYSDDNSYCKVDTFSLAATTAKLTAQCYSAAGAARDSGLVESYAIGLPPAVCQPTTLASDPNTIPTSVGANGSTVWFTNITAGFTSPGLVSVPRSGGASTTLVSGEDNRSFNSLLVTPSFVYWLETAFLDSEGALYRKPLVGGSPTFMKRGGVSIQRHALAYIAGNVYFADSGGARTVWRIDAAGSFTTLWPPDPSLSLVYPGAIAVDTTSAYFLRDTGDALQSAPLTGGVPSTLSTASSGTTNAIASDGAYVYWAANGTPGSIFKTPVGGGSTSTLASVGGVVTGLAVYGTDLYFTVSSPGKVGRISLTDVFATQRTVASPEDGPSSLFVDGAGAVWTTAHAVRILRR